MITEQEKLIRLEHATEKVIFVKNKVTNEIVPAVGRHSKRTELPFPLPKYEYADYYITDEDFDSLPVMWDKWDKVPLAEAVTYYKNNQDLEIRI